MNLACPTGWHVPSQNDWEILIDYLGGADAAGNKMKEAGNINWLDNDDEADNSSGFNALPAGIRFGPLFLSAGYEAAWWSSTKSSSDYMVAYQTWGNGRSLYIMQSVERNDGYSIRCLKD